MSDVTSHPLAIQAEACLFGRSLNTSLCEIYDHICVASLQKGPHVAKIKKIRFLLICIEQVMTNLLKKNSV